MFLGVLLMATLGGLCSGYPMRAPHPQVPDEVVCGRGVPLHGTQQQPDSSPYTITVSDNSVRPGGSVTVTVSSNTPAAPIRGLVMKAMCNESILGSFGSDSLDLDLRNCNGIENSGVLYIERTRRGILEAELTWTVPFDIQCQDVRFYATIVKDLNTYWVDQMSTQPLTVFVEE